MQLLLASAKSSAFGTLIYLPFRKKILKKMSGYSLHQFWVVLVNQLYQRRQKPNTVSLRFRKRTNRKILEYLKMRLRIYILPHITMLTSKMVMISKSKQVVFLEK